MATTHECYAKGCERRVEVPGFMCPQHWRMLPEDLRQTLTRLHRSGQEGGYVDPNPKWIGAARIAIAMVRQHEAKVDAAEGSQTSLFDLD